MKDFAASYEQLRWSHASTRHTRMTAWLAEPDHSPSFIEFCQREVARIESEYPQLKQPIVKETT